jgi:hypothetical protein
MSLGARRCAGAPAVSAFTCAGAGICGGDGADGAGGYARCLRPDEGDVPEARFSREAEQLADAALRRVGGTQGEGFTGLQVAVLSTRNDTARAAAAATEQS